MQEFINQTLFNHDVYLNPLFSEFFLILLPFFLLCLIVMFFRGLR